MSRTPHRWRRSWLVALTALAAVACGGDEPAEEAADAASEADDTASDDTQTADDQADDAASDDTQSVDDDADDADDESDAGADEGTTTSQGPAELRPTGGGPSDADCAANNTQQPGAEITFPSDGVTAGNSPVTVEVVGCSNTFEANLQYEVFHDQNTSPTLDGFTSGGTLGTWASFSLEETYWTPGTWRVEVFENNANTGARDLYDTVSFTVDP